MHVGTRECMTLITSYQCHVIWWIHQSGFEVFFACECMIRDPAKCCLSKFFILEALIFFKIKCTLRYYIASKLLTREFFPRTTSWAVAVSDSIVIFRWCTSQILKELVIVYLSNIRILFFLPFYSFYRFYSSFSMKHLQMLTNALKVIFIFFFVIHIQKF